MKAQLIKIGNTHGIRLSKSIIEKCKLNGELNIEIKENSITINAIDNPRHGWEKAFKKDASKKESAMVDGDGMNVSSWDESEWEWK